MDKTESGNLNTAYIKLKKLQQCFVYKAK